MTCSGSQAYLDDDFRTALDYLATGTVQVAPLVTGRINLEDTVARGLGELAQHPADHLKILVYPQGP